MKPSSQEFEVFTLFTLFAVFFDSAKVVLSAKKCFDVNVPRPLASVSSYYSTCVLLRRAFEKCLSSQDRNPNTAQSVIIIKTVVWK